MRDLWRGQVGNVRLTALDRGATAVPIFMIERRSHSRAELLDRVLDEELPCCAEALERLGE